jgi:MFS family permease
MTGGQVPRAKGYTQAWQAFGATLGCLVAPLVGEKLGRRPVYCALCLLSFAAATALFRLPQQFNLAFLAQAGLVGFLTAAFYGWLPLYLPELFPTRVRATGQGLAFNFGRIFAAVGAWQMGSILGFFHNSYPAAGAAIVMIYFVGAALIWVAPETRGRPLPE